MRRIIYLLALLLVMQKATAQCKGGDCNNGKGVYDFGWCIYNGEFKDGKPEGTGTMKYDDYSYTGSFKNGVEDGQGVITYKNGKVENVIYSNGVKSSAGPAKVAAADWKELKGTDPGCIRGICETGFGTYKFPSGNVYTGNFVSRQRQGNGKMVFSNGDILEGTFNRNEIVEGTYTFNNGCRFTGRWNNQGEMYNGTWYSVNGMPVKMVNGQVIPPEPTAEQIANLPRGAQIVYGDTPQETCANWVKCPRCNGRRMISKPIVTTYSWTVGGSSTIDRYGNRHVDIESVSGGHTSTIPNYEVCDKCGGKGQICGEKK